MFLSFCNNVKVVTSSASNVSLTVPENESNENPDNNVKLQKDTEKTSLSAKNQKTVSIQSNTKEINHAVPIAYGDKSENNDDAVAVVNNFAQWCDLLAWSYRSPIESWASQSRTSKVLKQGRLVWFQPQNN